MIGGAVKKFAFEINNHHCGMAMAKEQKCSSKLGKYTHLFKCGSCHDLVAFFWSSPTPETKKTAAIKAI